MAVNIRSYGKLFNLLMYGDTCTISRLNQTTDEYGATISKDRKEVYVDIKCKFSFAEKDSPSDGNEVYMPVLKQVTVFTDLDYDIKAGDYIKGYRVDKVSGIKEPVEGICGKPNRFDTHQEIAIQIEGEN